MTNGLSLTMAFLLRLRMTLAAACVVCVCAGNSPAQDAPADAPEASAADGLDTDDILDLDLESLSRVDVVAPSFEMEVTSVTKSKSTIGKSPAAVFVITNEMIRRSGVTSVPEALRMAPGLVVSRIDANKWAISSRGFSGLYSNKLQVLIDGRSIYTPIFSGVRWDRNDVLLEDVQRIEVIRGPGASVWGANAVNGVINIITKDAHDTQGVLASAGGGNEDRSINSYRHGSKVNGQLAYRVYGKHTERDSGVIDGQDGADDWRQLRAGIRTDWKSCVDDCSHFTFIAEAYDLTSGSNVEGFPTPTPPFVTSLRQDTDARGAFALGRWTQQITEDDTYTFQAYYDHRHDEGIYGGERLDVLDFELQNVRGISENQTLTWGLGYRLMVDHLSPSNPTAFTISPRSRSINLFSGFLQDEITLVPDDLWLTLGCKFEHNDYSGFEYQPTIRLLKAIDDRNVVWGAVSRAVRTPSRVDNDFHLRFLVAPNPVFSDISGDSGIEAEDLTAYEVGYRSQPSDRFAWDIAGFFNDYEDLIAFTRLGAPVGFPPTFTTPASNIGSARTWGVETTATYEASERWRLSGWYAWMDYEQSHQPGTTNAVGFANNQFRLTSSHDLSDRVQADAMLRYVDAIEEFDASAYWSLDLRLGWKLNKYWDANVVGQNLLDGERFEYTRGQTHEVGSAAQRGVFASLTYRR